MIEEYWQESLTIKARNCSEYDAYNELFIIYSDGFFSYESAKKGQMDFLKNFKNSIDFMK